MSAADLKPFALFADLGDEEADLLAELLEERLLRDGQQLFREGQEAEGLVLLLEGALRLESRRTGELPALAAPAAVGSASLGSVGPREATAFAAGEARVLMLSRSAFQRFAEDSPRAALRVMEAVLGELGSLMRGGLDPLAATLPPVDPTATDS